MSSRYDLDIPAVGAAGPGYATKINDAIATLNGDFIVDTIDDRDAIASPAHMAFCLVKSIDRIFWWDDDVTTWKSVADVDYINVQDFGAHWSLTNNAPAFQAASDASVRGGNGGTDKRTTILIPPAPGDATDREYKFTEPWNLRASGGLRIIATAGNKDGFFLNSGSVMLMNTTNSEPIIDADKEADGLSTFTPNIFENISFYNPAATPFVGSGIHGWQFIRCAFTTFADTPAWKTQNTFGASFDKTNFVNANGSVSGACYLSGMGGTSSDADHCYQMAWTDCGFNGGPWVEHHFFSNAGGSGGPGLFNFTNCAGENPAGDEGVLIRATKETGIGNTVSNCTYINCLVFDPVSGSAPYTTFSVPTGSSLVSFNIIGSGMANAGGHQAKCRDGDGSNFVGFFVKQSAMRFVNSDNELTANVYVIDQSNGKGQFFIGDPTSGAPDLHLDPSVETGRAHIWGLQGEEYGRIGIGYDGYVFFASGAANSADVSMNRPAANRLGVNGADLAITTQGRGLRIKEGGNAKQHTAVLVAGTVTVANTSVTGNSRIFVTSQEDGGTPGFVRVSSRVPGTSFTIASSSATDTSTVAWFMTEPG